MQWRLKKEIIFACTFWNMKIASSTYLTFEIYRWTTCILLKVELERQHKEFWFFIFLLVNVILLRLPTASPDSFILCVFIMQIMHTYFNYFLLTLNQTSIRPMCLIFKNVNFILKVVVFIVCALVLARTLNGLDQLNNTDTLSNIVGIKF